MYVSYVYNTYVYNIIYICYIYIYVLYIYICVIYICVIYIYIIYIYIYITNTSAAPKISAPARRAQRRAPPFVVTEPRLSGPSKNGDRNG